MRQIKFRGKEKDNSRWMYGLRDSYFWNNINLNTLGQFTGLTDKNGNEIYEGDRCIINFCFSFYNKIAIVYYKDARFYLDDKHPEGNLPLSAFVDSKRNSSIEIIGNIHDNPELLNPQ